MEIQRSSKKNVNYYYASSKLKVKISDWYKVLEGVSVEKVRSLMAEYIEKID